MAASEWLHRAARAGPPRILVAGVSSLALTAEFFHPGSNGGEVISSTESVAQLLHAGADRGEVVGSTGLVHVCSSHVRSCFEAGDRLTAAERRATLDGLTAWRKPRSRQARHPTRIGQAHTRSTPIAP